MTSNRPYLVRAYYDWILDNNLTPHLVVDATCEGVVVPHEHVKDGQIVLNISPTACGNLVIGDVDIEFDARFSGVPRHLRDSDDDGTLRTDGRNDESTRQSRKDVQQYESCHGQRTKMMIISGEQTTSPIK